MRKREYISFVVLFALSITASIYLMVIKMSSSNEINYVDSGNSISTVDGDVVTGFLMEFIRMFIIG